MQNKLLKQQRKILSDVGFEPTLPFGNQNLSLAP